MRKLPLVFLRIGRLHHINRLGVVFACFRIPDAEIGSIAYRIHWEIALRWPSWVIFRMVKGDIDERYYRIIDLRETWKWLRRTPSHTGREG